MATDTTAPNVAAHILSVAREKGFAVDNLKLQKLLYYAQAWHLALAGTPLFCEPIEAWVHGPVVPSVFRQYRHLRWSAITTSAIEPEPLSPPSLDHINEIVNEFGRFTGSQLERMTHREIPWITARLGTPPDEPSSAVITPESMTQFYKQVDSE